MDVALMNKARAISPVLATEPGDTFRHHIMDDSFEVDDAFML